MNKVSYVEPGQPPGSTSEVTFAKSPWLQDGSECGGKDRISRQMVVLSQNRHGVGWGGVSGHCVGQ